MSTTDLAKQLEGSGAALLRLGVLVKFRAPATFARYMELKLMLEDLWGRKVDLVTEAAVRSELRQMIVSEAVRVA
jgi:predicted nucleotidyltransferase